MIPFRLSKTIEEHVIPQTTPNAIIFALTHERKHYKLNVSDVNMDILKDEPLASDDFLYALYTIEEKTIVLSAQQYPIEYYFHFGQDGVYVDSIVLRKKVYVNDGVNVEKATIKKAPLGTIRLQEFTDDIWNASDVKFVQQ
jgi:hypothetical protein